MAMGPCGPVAASFLGRILAPMLLNSKYKSWVGHNLLRI
jgi:hypothetical protein